MRTLTGRPNRILAVVLGAVALVAVVAAVVAATRTSETYDRGTPEGVVQAYLAAVVDGDNTEAVGYLAPDSSCDVEDLDRAWVPDGVRVVLRDTRVDGENAEVEVSVVTSSGDLFGGSEFGEDHTFRLGKTGQEWLIEGLPWPMYDCSKGG